MSQSKSLQQLSANARGAGVPTLMVDGTDIAILVQLVQNLGGTFKIGSSGLLEVMLADGTAIVTGSNALVEAWGEAKDAKLAELNAKPELLITWAVEAGLLPAQGIEGFDAAILTHLENGEGSLYHLDGLGSSTALLRQLLAYDNPLNNSPVNRANIYATNAQGRVATTVGNDVAHLLGLPDEDYIDGIDPDQIYALGNDGFVGVPQPTISPDTYTVLEDGTATGNVFDNDSRPNGPGTAVLGNPPTNGTLVFNPDGTFTYAPDPDFSGVDTFTYSYTDPILGTVHTGTVTINVTPVADAPTLPPVLGPFNTEEDTAVPLTGISGGLTDTDGSETLTYQITGVPPGATFNGGTNLGGGVWSFTPAQLAVLTFTPPFNLSGTFPMTLVAISTETGNGDTATITRPFTVVVDAQVEPPLLTPGTSTVNEDGSVNIGGVISYSPTDLDGSENISQVEISSIPPGSNLNWTPSGSAVVVYNPGAGTWTVTSTNPDPALAAADIRATLDTLTYDPPADLGDNVSLTISVTVTDADGSQNTAVGTHVVDVVPVADAPSVPTGSTTLDEDVGGIFGTGVTYALTDTDGSEVVSSVTLTGFPGGSTVNFTVSGAAVVTPVAGGYIITGSEADIRATLDSFSYIPPANTDTNTTLTVVVETTDSNGDTATSTSSHNLLIAAVADAPTGSGSGSGNEDVAIPVPVTIAVSDADGSEEITQVQVTAPAGVVLGGFGPSGATVAQVGQIWTISGSEAQIIAALAAMTATPPLHVGTDFSLSVAITATETTLSGGEVSTSSTVTTISVPVAVTPVADAPTPIVANFTTEEDTTVSLAGLGGTLTDADGSETLSYRIEGVPSGVTFNGGTMTGPGVWSFTAAELAALTLTPPDDWHGPLNLTLVAISTESENADAAEASANFTVTVSADADVPSLTPGSSTVNEDASVNIGTQISYVPTDTDGSEHPSQVVVSGIPAGSTLNWTPSGNAAVVFNPGAGTWTVTSTDPDPVQAAADIRATLDTLTYQPPLHRGSDVLLTIAITVRDADGSVATQTGTHTVDVVPVADAPTAPAGSTPVNEDTATIFGTGIAYGLVDADGSEAVSAVTLTGFPLGSIVSYTAGGATVSFVSGVYTITGTAADIRTALNSFSYIPPSNSDANTTLAITVTTTDSNGDTATTNSSHNLNVAAVADAPTGSGSGTGNEDTAIPVPVNFAVTDTDGSETITQVAITAPAGVVLGGFGPSGATVAQVGQVWTVTGTPVQISAALAAMTATPPQHSGANFSLSVAITSSETTLSGGEVTTPSATTIISVPVTVVPVADAPTVSAGATPVNEDTATIFGTGITYALVDTDGSESVSAVTLTGFPLGSIVSYSAGGATVSLVSGVYTITGSAAAIRAALDTFSYIPPFNSDANTTLTIGVTTTDSNGTTATTTSSHGLNVAAIADAPSVTVLPITVNEDTNQSLGTQISYALTDVDGSENITRVEITGFPAGGAFSLAAIPPGILTAIPGGYAITSSNPDPVAAAQEIRDSLDLFGFNPTVHSDSDFNLTVAVTTTETTLSGGEVTTLSATQTIALPVTVIAVADAPNITVTNFATEEDTTVALVGLGGSLVDADGSETLSYRIEGVPAGTTFNAGSMTGPGVWTFTAAQLATLTLTPPNNWHGSIPLTLVAVATESSNNNVAEQSAAFTVTVDAQADTPSLTPGSSTVNEDSTVNIGTQISYAPTDADGSEHVTSVSIGNVPVGSVFNYTGAPTVLVSFNIPTNTYTFTSTNPDLVAAAAEIRAALDTVTLQPPAHVGTDIVLAIGVTVTDADGSTATQTGTHTVDVVPVADAPTVFSSANIMDEDTTSTFGSGVGYGLVDTDGSEAVSEVILGGFPAGSTVNWILNGSSVVTGGPVNYTITSTNPDPALAAAEIRATLNSFSFRPPANSDVNTTISVTVETTDSNGSTATAASTHTFFVDAVADAPTGSGTGTGNEDTAISVPVTLNLTDADGSETITQVEITAPAGVVLGGFGPSGATVVQAGQVWTVTGTPAQITAAMLAMTATPPLHSDTDFNLSVAIRSSETNPSDGGVTTLHATNTIVVPVVVTAVADAPTPIVANFTTEEDTSVNLTGLGATLTDADGSETLSYRIEGLPLGTTFNVGSSAGVGMWSVTAAQLATLSLLPPDDWHGVMNLTLVAITTEASNADTEEASAPFTVTVDAQADVPNLTPGATTTPEDVAVNVGSQISYSLNDTDGSENVSQVTISGIPTGAIPSVGTFGTATFNYNAGTGVVTIAATNPDPALAAADIRGLLNTLMLLPPTHVGSNIALTVQVQVTDADGSTATQTGVHVVDVVPVADLPTVTGGTFSTNEDTAVALPGLAGSLVDVDGSETLTFQITGVPTGASFSTGSLVSPGVWGFTAAQISAGINFMPPAQQHGTFNMVLQSIATEAEGSTVTNTAPVVVTVNPILDIPVIGASATSVLEDQTISLGQHLDISIADMDGSQSMDIVLSGIPVGYVPTWNTGLPGTVTNTAPGEWTFAGTTAQALALLDTFVLPPVAHADADFTVAIDVTTTEAGGATTTVSGSHSVNVRAVADAPTVSGAATGNEDTTITVPITVALVDSDGTETLSSVQIAGVPATATLTIVTSGAAIATNMGGGVWQVTGPTADIIATLSGGVSILPGLHLGNDIPLTVTAQSTESSPTEVGDVAVLNATTIGIVNVNVVPVADTPNIIAQNFNTEEDTAVHLTGFAGSLTDTDGSEVLTYQLSGVPAGVSFNTGTNMGGGIWSFTAAQMTGGVWFTPPLNWHGTLNTLTLTAIATETENGSQAINAVPIIITVDAQADAPLISGSSTTQEDTAISFGNNISVSLYDTDGSETLTSVAVEMPTGFSPSMTIMGAAVVNLSGDTYTITGPQADILATLATFAVTPPLHSDANFTVVVSANTIDADGSTNTATQNHVVTVQAVADMPSGSAANVSGWEEGTIPLSLAAVASADTDGSEVTSVRLTNLPAGTVISGDTSGGGAVTQSGNDWIITAPSLAQLNAILATAAMTPPLHYSGVMNATMQVISTETATGIEVATPTASASYNFTVTVNQVVDAPIITVVSAVEGAAGYEDTIIPLVVDVRLADNDGSESLVVVVISNIPAGATIVDGSGAPLGTIMGPGVVSISIAQLAQLHIMPPQHFNGDFQLDIQAHSVETPQGLAGDNTIALSNAQLDVHVIGVADAPNIVPVPVVATEDQPIALGAAVTASLVDTDGSESLYYVISGLPAGVVPSAGTYIGGNWQVSAAQMATLTVPAPANFSGDYVAGYAPALSIRAITQENDGHQTSVTVPLQIYVNPVLDAVAPGLGTEVNEGSNISLAGMVPLGFADGDGSESVVSYTIDLNGVIAAAGIGAIVASTNTLITNHITGTFTNNGDGTITVLAANLAGVALMANAFVDSNRDFAVSFTVNTQDVSPLMTVNGSTAGSFNIDLVGVADVPTVFADDYSGTTGTPVAVNPTGAEFGGITTDTDVALGQGQSESIYYIVSGMYDTAGLTLAFVDNTTGMPVGFNNNNGTWILTPAQLANLAITAVPGTSGAVTLTLTTVATENDGDVATNSTTFDVNFGTSGGGGPGVIPLPPIVVVNPMTVNEDGSIALDIDVTKDPLDPSVPDPTLTVVIHGIPADATVVGAFFNSVNNTWVTDAATLLAGGVTVQPGENYSGPINITVDAVATNINLAQAAAAPVAGTINVTPVADPVDVTFTTPGGDEDVAIPVNISFALTDLNGTVNEQLQEPVVITVGLGATLSAGNHLGGGVYQLTMAELVGLTATSALHNGNDIPITIQVTSVEPANGDTEVTTFNGTIPVTQVADAPVVMVANVSGNEDTAIALAGLTANLVDTDGSEILSITLSGMPDGSILNAGSNNGDGSWTIPVAALATLTLKPPLNFSGTINLTLTAFALESSGVTAMTTSDFVLTVLPVGDTAVVTPLPQSGDEGQPIALNLNIQPGDATGTEPSENPAETVSITLTGMAAGLVATTSGGIVTNLGGGIWTFTGTTAEANTLAITADGVTGAFSISAAVTMYDGVVPGTPVNVTVPLTVTAVADQTLTGTGSGETLAGAGGDDTINGLGGNDTINGGAGIDTIDGGANNDNITGGLGADIITGGSGADTYLWQAIDILSGAVDTITDFSVGQGDVLDLSSLLAAFNPGGGDVIADFVNLSASGGDTIVQIDQTGTGTFTTNVATLSGLTGLDLAVLYANGNIAA